MIRLSKKYSGLQFFAPEDHYINVDGSSVQIYLSTSYNATWLDNANYLTNPSLYKIVDDKVMWYNSVILQYKGVDVSPTDFIHDYEDYTTRATEETWLLNDEPNLGDSSVEWAASLKCPDSTLYADVLWSKLYISVTTFLGGTKALNVSNSEGSVQAIYSQSSSDTGFGNLGKKLVFTKHVSDESLLTWLNNNGQKINIDTNKKILASGDKILKTSSGKTLVKG